MGVFFAVHAAVAIAWGATVWAGPQTDVRCGGPDARCRRADSCGGPSRKGNVAADQHDSREGQCGAVASMDEFLRRSPLLLVASGSHSSTHKPIGRCGADDRTLRSTPVRTRTDWLASVDRPIVLVTTSSEKQADDNLVQTAMTALADEPVHVVATCRPDNQTELRRRPMRRFPVAPARRSS